VRLPSLSSGGPAAVANALRRVLGVLWLADALVKVLIPVGGRAADQSYEQIMMAETGPPGLHRLLAWETSLFLAHPFLWWLAAAVELGIGLWLVTRPASRRALAVSAVWAVVVWVAGEGMGGLFSASSILTGYPGAALLYAIAAAALLPRRQPREEAAAAAEAGIAGQWSRVAWLALWIGAAFVTALPQNGSSGVVSMLFINEQEAPAPLRSMDASELGWLTVGNTTILGIAVAAACLAIGFTVFLGVLPRVFLPLGALIAVAGWVAMQNLGGILTGSATDVGTGPVLILLALAFWPLGRTTKRKTAQQRAAGEPRLATPQREAHPASEREPAG
jgi:hypothetical protein